MADRDEQKNKLSDEAYRVLKEKGTEAPFSGELLYNEEAGTYHCAACGAKLFESDAKYESTQPGLIGWPSFNKAIKDAVRFNKDTSAGMNRTEVTCAACGGHLGHVFKANDSSTGTHYCINSVALSFKKGKK